MADEVGFPQLTMGGLAERVQATGAFQWSTDVDDSFEWLIDLTDRGLRAPEDVGTA